MIGIEPAKYVWSRSNPIAPQNTSLPFVHTSIHDSPARGFVTCRARTGVQPNASIKRRNCLADSGVRLSIAQGQALLPHYIAKVKPRNSIRYLRPAALPAGYVDRQGTCSSRIP